MHDLKPLPESFRLSRRIFRFVRNFNVTFDLFPLIINGLLCFFCKKAVHSQCFLPQSFAKYTQSFAEFRPPSVAKSTQRRIE